MKLEQRVELFTRLQRANPHPTTELEYSSPFELLIAVLLSAQATDVSVNKATRNLFAVAHTPQAMLALGEERLTEHIKTIGLYRNKAKNAIATCRMLVDLHGGQVPNDRAALEALPGVGRKTANVVLNTAFGEPTIAVDTHIFRVSNRLKLASGKNVAVVETKLMKAVPEPFKKDAHHWLILHGRYVCKARSPECWRCIVADLCAFKPKTPDPDADKAQKTPRKDYMAKRHRTIHAPLEAKMPEKARAISGKASSSAPSKTEAHSSGGTKRPRNA
jgi:endonuclease III